MSDKRRAEIEAKRAKLAELRKAKERRQQAETERRREVRIWTYLLQVILTYKFRVSKPHVLLHQTKISRL